MVPEVQPETEIPPPSSVATERVEQDRLRYLARRGSGAVETLARVEKYWTRGIAAGYLELLDEVASDDPRKAAAMAEAAPQLVERTAMARGEARWRSAAELSTYRALAWAFLASCRRQIADLVGARSAMEKALELAEREGVAGWARAEVARRHSILVAFVDGPATALPLTTRVIELFQATRYAAGLAEALAFQGSIFRYLRRYEESLEALSAALGLADGSTVRGRRTQAVAVFQLATVAEKASSSADVLRQSTGTVRALLKRTRSRQLRGRMLWTLGRLEMRVGAHRSASRQLRRAAETLAPIADTVALTLLALDIARLADQAGSDPSRHGVNAQTRRSWTLLHQALDAQPSDPELREIIAAWARGSVITDEEVAFLTELSQRVSQEASRSARRGARTNG